jgi:hypothetical protein
MSMGLAACLSKGVATIGIPGAVSTAVRARETGVSEEKSVIAAVELLRNDDEAGAPNQGRIGFARAPGDEFMT